MEGGDEAQAEVADRPPEPAPGRLGAGARRRRTAAAALVAGLLLAGSAVGTDDWFPLGPFRMYATIARTNGEVRAVALQGVDATGRARTIRPGDIGLRPAELEGQIKRFESRPELLAAIAAAWSSVHPDAPPLVTVELQVRARRVVDRILQDDVDERTVARWEAP